MSRANFSAKTGCKEDRNTIIGSNWEILMA